MKLILALITAVALSGCAQGQHEYYATETARHAAEQARWTSMAEIAKTGDATTNEALQWASILVPGLTQVAGMRYNYLSNQTQSNNAASVTISTNSNITNSYCTLSRKDVLKLLVK